MNIFRATSTLYTISFDVTTAWSEQRLIAATNLEENIGRVCIVLIKLE